MIFRDTDAATKIEATHGRTLLAPGQRVWIENPTRSDGWTIAAHSIEVDYSSNTQYVMYELRKDRLLCHAPAKLVHEDHVDTVKPPSNVVEVALNDG